MAALTYFDGIKKYIDCTVERYNLFLLNSKDLHTYTDFNKQVLYHKELFLDFRQTLDSISNNTVNSYLRVGYIMKCFYKFYYNKNVLLPR